MKGIPTKAQRATRLPPLASSDEERLAIALAKIGRLHAELDVFSKRGKPPIA
jgi:hypothetical protein